jgi:hypothetical protein
MLLKHLSIRFTRRQYSACCQVVENKQRRTFKLNLLAKQVNVEIAVEATSRRLAVGSSGLVIKIYSEQLSVVRFDIEASTMKPN